MQLFAIVPEAYALKLLLKESENAALTCISTAQGMSRQQLVIGLIRMAAASEAQFTKDETQTLYAATWELRKIGVFPVGRLDKDTEGLLLLTDDGELAHALLSPKKHVDKVYYARVSGRLTPEDCAAFEAGMTLGDGLECLPAGLEILAAGETSECLVTLREGKFHQVKRMLAARGKPVTYLKRLSMGSLRLDDTLAPGEFRLLMAAEEAQLQR